MLPGAPAAAGENLAIWAISANNVRVIHMFHLVSTFLRYALFPKTSLALASSANPHVPVHVDKVWGRGAPRFARVCSRPSASERRRPLACCVRCTAHRISDWSPFRRSCHTCSHVFMAVFVTCFRVMNTCPPAYSGKWSVAEKGPAPAHRRGWGAPKV